MKGKYDAVQPRCAHMGGKLEVLALFRGHYNIPLVHKDVSTLFLNGLAGVTDPEAKRKFIGKTFIDVFEEEARQIGGAEFLAQGTLYPDVIESVSFTGGPSVTIKTHHNVGGLPEKMRMKLIEPFRELFKDEVRAVGTQLGLPDDMIWRHPFPGPGLAVRVLGEITMCARGCQLPDHCRSLVVAPFVQLRDQLLQPRFGDVLLSQARLHLLFRPKILLQPAHDGASLALCGNVPRRPGNGF